jgi:hypothetical protein
MEKRMPIQVSGNLDLRERRGERICIVRSIPWQMIADEASERQSQRNHGQSLDHIADRGGFSACEAIAVISCQSWHDLGEERAHRILYAMHTLYNRGQRVAEERAIGQSTEASLTPPAARGRSGTSAGG